MNSFFIHSSILFNLFIYLIESKIRKQQGYTFIVYYNNDDVNNDDGGNIFRNMFSISEWYSLNYTNVIPLLNKLHRYFLLAHIFIFDFLIFAALVITYFVEGCKMMLKRGKMNIYKEVIFI